MKTVCCGTAPPGSLIPGRTDRIEGIIVARHPETGPALAIPKASISAIAYAPAHTGKI